MTNLVLSFQSGDILSPWQPSYVIIVITTALALVWFIALLERADAYVRLTREASVWSLVLVWSILCLHLVLLYHAWHLLGAYTSIP